MMNHWKTIQNYAGCNTFQELQNCLNLLYNIKIPIIDFQTQHPLNISKLLHMFQLSLLYFEDSSTQLIQFSKQIDKDQQVIEEEITLLEKKLIQDKTTLKQKQKKVTMETKQKDKFMQYMQQIQIQCFFCDALFTSSSQFDYHMKKSHKTEFNKKEIDIVTIATQNQLLQQQLALRVQQQNYQTLMTQQYQMLQKTKQQLSFETQAFMLDTMNVEAKLGQIDRRYQNRIAELRSEITDRLSLIEVNQEQEQQLRKEKIILTMQEIEKEIIKTNSQFLNKQTSTMRLKKRKVVELDEDRKIKKQLQTQESLQEEQLEQLEQQQKQQQQYQQSKLQEPQYPQYPQYPQQPQQLQQPQYPQLPQYPQQPQRQQPQQFTQKSKQQEQQSSEIVDRNQKITDKISKQHHKFNSNQSVIQNSFPTSQRESYVQTSRDQTSIMVDTTFMQNSKKLLIEHEQFQNSIFELLMNRTQGKRIECTPEQFKEVEQILEESISVPLRGYLDMDLRQLVALHEGLKFEMRVTAKSISEDDSVSENQSVFEINTRRTTNSAFQLIGHSRTPSGQQNLNK